MFLVFYEWLCFVGVYNLGGGCANSISVIEVIDCFEDFHGMML